MLTLPDLAPTAAPQTLAAAWGVTRLDTLWSADPWLEDGPGRLA